MNSRDTRPAPAKEDPPRHCPACGNDLSAHPYYRRVPSATARRLEVAALLTAPIMFVLLASVLVSGISPTLLSQAADALLLDYELAVVPGIAIYAVSSLIPKDFRVICLRCSWYRDFAFRIRRLVAKAR